MFLTLIQRLMSLYLTANHLWVFFVGPGPVRLVALLLWRRNAGLAGGFAGRPGLWFCGFVCWFAFLQVPANCAGYRLFHRLFRYQDRATEHLRPNSRKKKSFLCTGVQKCTLSRLNPVPPWRSGFKPIQTPSSALWRHTNQHRDAKGSRTREAPIQKSYQFQVQKTNPKTSLFVPSCLDHDNISLSIILMQACNRAASPGGSQARPGEAWRGQGEATLWTQNVLAQGQSEAHGDSKLIILLLKSSFRCFIPRFGGCVVLFVLVVAGFASGLVFRFSFWFVEWNHTDRRSGATILHAQTSYYSRAEWHAGWV